MRFKNYILLLLFAFGLSSFLHAHNGHGFYNRSTTEKSLNNNNSQENIVYICMGGYAYAYHSRSNCPGLGNCRSKVNRTYESVAINNFNRVPCCRCWANVYGRCKDDAQHTSYGGGSGDVETAIALGVLTAGVIMLSNDIYYYPTYSFKEIRNKNTLNKDKIGFALGFRRDMKKTILEYGLSFINTLEIEEYRPGQTESYYTNRTGGHFNVLRRIKHNKYQNGFFLGPSLNYVNDFGYGGIFGYEYKLFDRLKLDFRYEITTQTHQLQAGLIFKYQKDFFWKK